MEDNSFSIIIPAHGRPNGLSNCLRAICDLDYPRDLFEVIVVDDGSAVPLESTCEHFYNKLNLLFLSQHNAGPAAARNRGAEHAGGKYLAFTDDDCMPMSGWLKAMNNHLTENPHCAVGGRMINLLEGNSYAAASQILIDYLHEYHNRSLKGARFLTTSSLGVSMEDFREIGGFDVSFPRAAAEDRDFCARWLHSGRRIILDPKIKVFHAHVHSFLSYLKQHFGYGRGGYHFHRKCLQRGQESLRVEPLSFCRGLMLRSFSGAEVQSRPFMCALLFLSQVANTLGFAWEKLSDK